ncbi:enoyl-CoA hydratase/isomerase family protein [Micromonospora sp. CP22]|uniref:enoyl-CoA hydratase/isomerase family protein n=1 Tax=Micromonospora sp. CP22 TaxID=2580517 RepID=UPI0012BCA9E9|nr:enoyl-CoA hydratase/isomerase family protein [Micromonospora sp. CP22]MTK03424.1 enoyl-CoA hydratase/isomerase family protein [Micromonospora sp. CP22]
MDTTALATVRLDRSGPVWLVRLDNPPLHLMTLDMLAELAETFRRAAESDARALVLGAADGRAFCAGSDMREFAGLGEQAAERKVLVEDRMLRMLARLPFPTIAAIDQAALGGGLELALACDLRVVRQGVRLGLPEVKIGALAATGSQRLTKLVGPGRAKQLLLTGETIDAATARDWGLATEVVDGSAWERAVELAELLVSRSALSLRLAKQLVDEATDLPLNAGLVRASDALELIFASRELSEGVTSFLAKKD